MRTQCMDYVLCITGCCALYAWATKYAVTPHTLPEAAQAGAYDMLERLLAAPHDINTQDHRGNSALHCAAYREDERMLELLLRYHANPLLENVKGQTARDRTATPALQQLLTEHEEKYRFTRGRPVALALIHRRINPYIRR